MNTVAIIQARMGSTRLPGKVLRKIFDRTILGHLLTRVRTCERLDSIVVATPEAVADDAIAAEAQAYGAAVFRGSETDVLSRYYGAARAQGADVVVRITSDCPLYDPQLLDRMLAAFVKPSAGPLDYLSNVTKRTFPRGLDTEVFAFDALERAHREARQPYEREHVTPFLHQHPELFRMRSFEEQPDWSGLRWTLDTAEDWRFIEAVYQALYRTHPLFTTAEVLKLLQERPELTKINAHVEQKKLGQ